jgi:hypothetical protein
MLHELRIYHAAPGRLPDLHKRFETHTLALWKKHGIRQVGFWTVTVGAGSNDLYYLLEWDDLAARERGWNAFATDPQWLQAKAGTEANGPLTTSIDNLMLTPTAYSALR